MNQTNSKTHANPNHLLWGLLPLLLLLLGWQSPLGAATITTDQLDYAPYTYVLVSGTGYTPGENVQLTLEQLNADGITWSMVESNADWPNPWTIPADAGGNISDDWYVWTTDFIGVTFRLTATGADPTQTAATTFTDDNPHIDSYASNCTAGKDEFTLGETVCMKAAGLAGGTKSGRFKWWAPGLDPDTAQPTRTTDFSTTTGNASDSLQVSSCGTWIVKLYVPADTFQDHDTFTVTGCNAAPSCTAGGPYPSSCRSVMIGGASASDPDADALAYTWASDNSNISISPTSGAIEAGSGSRTIPTGTATLSDSVSPCDQSATLTLTVTDYHGHSSTCNTTVSFKDNVVPTFTVPADITIYTDANCAYDASVAKTGDVTDEADNCSTGLQATFSDSIANGTCTGAKVITRTWTLLDGCNNKTEKVQTITVLDNTPPTFTVPADITIYTDANCAYDASVAQTGDVTDEADNCSTGLQATFSDNIANGTCTGAKVITRTWTLLDGCNNKTEKVQTITVLDTIKPTASNPVTITVECVGDVPAPDVAVVTDEADNCTAHPVVAFVSDVSDHKSCPETITRTYSVTDACHNSINVTQTITVHDSTAPRLAIASFTQAPVALGKQAFIVANVSDNCTASPDVSVNWGGAGTESRATAPEGLVITFVYDNPGVYVVSVTAEDDCGNTEDWEAPSYFVVYDPNGGFVTGGGWIQSPAGASPSYPTAVGKANFGFVSKYQKGAQVPTGETEFQFKAGNLNFHSSAYEWLVIAGAKAQYKGKGAINGAGSYGFMLTAIDGQISGGGGVDKFRIKIWDSAGVVYDNQMNAPDTDDPTTTIAGGSIVIHK